MSGKVDAKVFSFPDQQAIIAYFDTHPQRSSVDAFIFQDGFPNSLGRVSQYFSDKVVEEGKLDSELRSVLVHRQLELWNNSKKRFEGLLNGDTPDRLEREWTASELQNNYKFAENAEQSCAAWTNIIVEIYSTVLKDQQENAFYTPPPAGEKAFVRHVRLLTDS